MENIISLQGIKKCYKDQWRRVDVIDNLDFTVHKGDFITIMGKSGCGKTTLLKIIGCLDKAYSGDYFLQSQLVSNMHNKQLSHLRNSFFGYVEQQSCLIERESVLYNIALPLAYNENKISKKDKLFKIEEILDKLEIGDKKNKKVCQLSGGEKQRVSIGRALISNPEVIIADEPSSALDSGTTSAIMAIFSELHRMGKTILIVTHDPAIVKYGSKSWQLEDGKIND